MSEKKETIKLTKSVNCIKVTKMDFKKNYSQTEYFCDQRKKKKDSFRTFFKYIFLIIPL